MASVFPTASQCAPPREPPRGSTVIDWEADVLICKINAEMLLEITLSSPIPPQANCETPPLLIENHNCFSGLWKIKKHGDEPCTVICYPIGGTLGESTPHYPYSVTRSDRCGLTIGPLIKQVNGLTKISFAPPLCIKVRGTVLSVSKVDTVEQTFQADVSFECRLRGISTVENSAAVESLLLAYGLIHTKMPVICLLNTDVQLERWETYGVSGISSSAGGFYDYTFKFRGKGTFAEEYELQRFPFDEQLLNVIVTVLKSERLITLEANEEFPSAFVVSNFQMNNIFSVAYKDIMLTERSFSSAKESASGLIYPRMAMKVLFQRKPTYYITNIALPMMVLTYLGFLSFAVDFEGQRMEPADRLGITLTLLLTAVAYKFVVASAIPQVSYLTWLDQYISFCFAYLCVIIGENALFPFLESRPGWTIRAVHELYVFYALVGLFSLVNVVWFLYVSLTLRAQEKRNRQITLLETVRREVGQTHKEEGRDQMREIVLQELLKQGLDVRKDSELSLLLGL